MNIEKQVPHVDELFEEWNRDDSPGAAIAIIQDGEVIFKNGYGLANLEYSIPITPSTIFHVASIAKQFTAYAVAQLEQEGIVCMDDEVRQYVPEVPQYSHPVTLRHLAHHISGIREQDELLTMAGWRIDDVITTRQILKLISKQQDLNFEPGNEFYSAIQAIQYLRRWSLE